MRYLPSTARGTVRATFRWSTRGLLAALLLLGGCADEGLRLRGGDAVRIRVVLPENAGPGLTAAGEDLVEAFARISGATDVDGALILGEVGGGGPFVRAVVDPEQTDALGSQGYRVQAGALDAGGEGLQVTAATQQGAAYGLYRIAHDLGVRYFHPEETYYPSDPLAELPQRYADEPDLPRFEERGFHEHTQHPIPASDWYLRPGSEERRAMASRYLRWLLRNRQNVMSFQMLRGVEDEAWREWMRDILEEADGYFLERTFVAGFVDEQQNSYRLIRPGDDRADEVQIEERLGGLLDLGFDAFTLQIGASEFTRPADADLMRWLQATIDLVREQHPDVQMWTWIHITCDLLAEDGSLYFHLPLRADPDIGAWVHTTMYYDLQHPAPVYGCEDFGHQRRFMDEAEGERAMAFFPESAWWLGFDNNMPLVLPVTGWSRAWDIQQELEGRSVRGHVTFTSGREWTYWQYDHYLTRVTWDGELTWESYLEEIGDLYGGSAGAVAEALTRWTELQRRHFYEERPLIYFYLAGELPQDEVGARAGIFARRPKRSFREVLEMDDAQLARWREEELGMLERMLAEHREVLSELPEALEGADPEAGDAEMGRAGPTEQQQRLFREVRLALEVYVHRIEHAIALYSGVVAARRWFVESSAATPDAAVMGEARAEADARLAEAEAITDRVRDLVREQQRGYRYPPDILIQRKPESPTIYPYGYLHETSTALFWARRDDQLRALIVDVFEAADEGWAEPQPELAFLAPPDRIEVTTPDDPVAAGALAGFLPGLLFGVPTASPEAGPLTLRVAQDSNRNQRPDPDTEHPVDGTLTDTGWQGSAATYPVVIRDDTGAVVTTLEIQDLNLSLDARFDPTGVVTFTAGTLFGQIRSAAIVEVIGAVTGTSEDSAANLIKQVYGIDSGDPLPELLPLEGTFELVLVAP